jgi:hypothetical protein
LTNGPHNDLAAGLSPGDFSASRPLATRRPLEGNVRPLQNRVRPERPTLQRCQSETAAYEGKVSASDTAKIDSTKADNNQEGQHKLDMWTHGVQVAMPRLKGFGRHIMAVDADKDFQREHLKRTMSDLTDDMVQQLGDFNRGGYDPDVWNEYRESRRSSATSSTTSLAKMNPLTTSESFDSKRSVSVHHGFGSSLIPSSSSSISESLHSGHYRKDSSISIASMSSDVATKPRRRKSRQISLPVSENSASPLDTISEIPDANDKSRVKKVEHPCNIDETANNDTAVVSDDSEDDVWMPELQSASKPSHLTRKISQEATRSSTRSRDETKSRRSAKAAIDRSKTARYPVRPDRRVHAHRQTKPKPIHVDLPKIEVSLPEDALDDQAAKQTISPSPSPPMTFSPIRISDESTENPTDLEEYMDKAKHQHSSKVRRKQNRQSDDDNASTHSDSTTKTIVPLATRLMEALPIHNRQRSATAIRIPSAHVPPTSMLHDAGVKVSQKTAF